ncbi:MAG: Trp family transcriptional regulator [Patescibacteria group bacterium]
MKKKEKLKEYKKEILDAFLKASTNKELMGEFLVDIMTPAELEEAAIRWQIIKRLNKKETHRAIAGELGVGISTVNRGARELRNKNGGFALILKKMGF